SHFLPVCFQCDTADCLSLGSTDSVAANHTGYTTASFPSVTSDLLVSTRSQPHRLAWHRQKNIQESPAQVAFMISHLSGKSGGLGYGGMGSRSCASRALFELRQKSRRVMDYAIEFRTLATDSGWNSPAIKGAFVNGLNDDIKDQLAPHEIPEEFEDLVKMAVRIDLRLQERETERRRAARRTSEHQGVPSPRRGFRRSSVFSSSTAERAPSSDQAEPMQLGRARLDPEERRRRARVGACFYCGQAGHRAQSCPVKEGAHHASGEMKPDLTSVPAPGEFPDLEKVPQCYHDLREVFSKTKAMSLPPHRPWDCPIDLLPGAPIPKARLYAISGPERKAMEEYIKTSLQSGIIRPSSSAAGAGFFFVEKKDGSLRPCIDYSALNDVTIKNRYPLPLISSAFELLQQARIFTKLGRVMNGRQGFINEVLREYLNDFVFVYLDDILIFSPDPATHQRHVRLVLSRLLENKLFVKAEKCEFHASSVAFLGFVVSPNCIKMDPEKVSAVANWPPLTSRKKVQQFLGFANFYRKFIRNFSAVAAPLHALTSPKVTFQWGPEAEGAFQKLKKLFISAPVLIIPDPKLQFIVEVDASNEGVGAVLSQRAPRDNRIHPCAFLSRKLSSAERNYDMGNRELLAIKVALEEWRHWLEGG
ncbi:hypothetical protein L3Q82_008481, partial [Scortum barcoo]